MSNKSVYAIAVTHKQTKKIVSYLKAGGFSNDRISVLFPDKSTTKDIAHEKDTNTPENAGGLFDGALSWIAGMGTLTIPGVGPFIAAGPIVAAGAAVGGITGALVGMGFSEIEAERYEEKIKEGNILIYVLTKDGDEVDRVKRILKAFDADDICTASTENRDLRRPSRMPERVPHSRER